MADKTTRKPSKPPTKRPWRRPQVKTGQLFESNSLACGKSSAMMMEQCAQMGIQQS